MKLNEIYTPPRGPRGPRTGETFSSEHERIEWWCKAFDLSQFSIGNSNGKYWVNTDDTRIDVPLDILQAYGLTKLPFSFGAIDGDFFFSGQESERQALTSLEGSPTHCGRFGIADCKGITSLEFLPRTMYSSNGNGSALILSDSGITSLEGIHEHVDKIDGTIALNTRKIKSGGIGLVLISSIWNFVDRDGGVSDPFKIIRKYLQKPDKIFECQNELIEAGFEEYAKL